MRVLVTGPAGLIGGGTVRQLVDRGHDVVGVVRGADARALPGGVERVVCDLARGVPPADAVGAVDAVVHLAQSSRFRDFPAGASEVLAVGAEAAVGLAALALECGASRFVVASSGGVYAPGPAPLGETSPLGPAGELGYYLTVKRVTEELVEQFRPVLPVSILRYFFVYGPGQSEQMFMPRLVGSVRAGKPVMLPGGRGPRMNPVFVDDAAAATVACIESGPPVVNVAGPEVADVRTIAETIGEILGTAPAFEDAPAGAGDLVADTSVVDALAPARVGLRDGLERLVRGG